MVSEKGNFFRILDILGNREVFQFYCAKLCIYEVRCIYNIEKVCGRVNQGNLRGRMSTNSIWEDKDNGNEDMK